jgi:ABC-type microcin C transport system duplicated ATPase subunit YejF
VSDLHDTSDADADLRVVAALANRVVVMRQDKVMGGGTRVCSKETAQNFVDRAARVLDAMRKLAKHAV